jgi:hypothetical protein
MSNNTKIFSEAIAEAKAIRETAMTNAKLALEEAFAPRMQEMMSNKLEALAEEDEEMEEGFTGKNGAMTSNDGDDAMEEDYGQAELDATEDEISLEELIAELDGLEESSYSEKEGSVNPGINDPYMGENTLAEAEDEDAVGEITVDDLKDIIRDVLNDVMGSEEGEEEEMGEDGEEGAEEIGAEDELELDEILAELDSLEEGDDDIEEGIGSAIKGAAQKVSKGIERAYDAVANAPELGVSKKLAKNVIDPGSANLKKAGVLGTNMTRGQRAFESKETELDEALKTISILRANLNEVNLLNAKLLYVNKLFKGKNLTEAQKVKVINAFDRAETVKETKNIFETLKESLTVTKAPIKESLSFASKAAGSAPNRQPIVEGEDFIKRMQKIAGII